jgi:hypothetical protein
MFEQQVMRRLGSRRLAEMPCVKTTDTLISANEHATTEAHFGMWREQL